MSLVVNNKSIAKIGIFAILFSFWFEKSDFALDENHKQNDRKNHKKDETHTVYAFTVLRFWEYLGMIGQ